MADNAALFKLTAKAIGLTYGIMPSFMAKPHNNLPGCSGKLWPPIAKMRDSNYLRLDFAGHVHISLCDKEGKNIFAASEERKEGFADLKWASKELEYFIAGVLKGLDQVMPCLVPTVNG